MENSPHLEKNQKAVALQTLQVVAARANQPGAVRATKCFVVQSKKDETTMWIAAANGDPGAEHGATSVQADQPAQKHRNHKRTRGRTLTESTTTFRPLWRDSLWGAQGGRAIAGGRCTRFCSRAVCQRVDPLPGELVSAALARSYSVERVTRAVSLARGNMTVAEQRVRRMERCQKSTTTSVLVRVYSSVVNHFSKTGSRLNVR